MIGTKQILNFIIQYCIDDPKLRVSSFSTRESDYHNLQSEIDNLELAQQKELILEIFESLWLLPNHIDLYEVGHSNENVFQECITYFINGDFINDQNVIFFMIDKEKYISNILNAFYDQFPIEGLNMNDPIKANAFREYKNSQSLEAIQEFWAIFIKYQILFFKYGKNGLGFDEWNNFSLSVYNELFFAENKTLIFDQLNNVLSQILNPKEYMLD